MNIQKSSIRVGAVFSLLLMCTSCTFPRAFGDLVDLSNRTAKSKPIIISAPEEFFLKSDQLFREGKYWKALREIRRIYQDAVDPLVEEEALFRITMILSYGENPNRDYGETQRVAKAFLKNYPESKRKLQVQSILLLLQEIERGAAEIETLKGYNAIQDDKIQRLEEDIRSIKEIDLQLEEQKKKLE
jgi:hypothetical protein